jgi:hypothetical protein
MSQDVVTTNDLIIDSLQLLGELSPSETPDAYMLSRGIMLINELIDKFTADSIYIPFLTTLNFTMVPGQDVYSFSDIVAGTDVTSDRIVNLSFVNYIVNGVAATSLSYPVRIINKATYNNVVRQIGLLARPGFCFLNRQATESFITFYPAPDQPYPCIVQAKVMIDSLSPFQDISALPPYYYGFFKYAMARKFLGYYPSNNWPQTNEDEYQDYYNNLKNTNETDLTITPSVTMTAPEPFYWPNILSY